jgi:hypothetical protein
VKNRRRTDYANKEIKMEKKLKLKKITVTSLENPLTEKEMERLNGGAAKTEYPECPPTTKCN